MNTEQDEPFTPRPYRMEEQATKSISVEEVDANRLVEIVTFTSVLPNGNGYASNKGNDVSGEYVRVADYDSVCAELATARETIAANVKELNGAYARTSQLKDEIWQDFIEQRGIEKPCPTCSGFGVRAYANTAGWHGGIGGNMITSGICDKCWGSGDIEHKGADLRRVEGIEKANASLRAEVDSLKAQLHAMSDNYAGLLAEAVVLREDNKDLDDACTIAAVIEVQRKVE